MKHYLTSADEVLSDQRSTHRGLKASDAADRLTQMGKNQLESAKPKSLAMRFLEQLRDPMVIILIIAALISGISGEIADTIIIMLVVLLNAVLGVVQENKAEKAIESLQRMSAPITRVRRDGSVMEIPTQDVVPGDIVLLEAGDAVPADMRLIMTASLKIEEAALTGESVASDKTSDALASSDDSLPLGDRSNMAYMGTNVVYGRGEGVVTATGMSTEMGHIAGILARTEQEKTPLQKTLAKLSRILSLAVLFICLFIFVFDVLGHGGIYGGHMLDSLLTAVSLAVAAIPEGLVMVVTVLLSIGVTKMSTRNAIIRRLTAVETLGCTEVICSDKTGTLTQNKMTVTDHFGDEGALGIAFGLCNDVSLDSADNVIGEPTETGLYRYAASLGSTKDKLDADFPRVGEAPFDSVRKMMSTIHQADESFVQYTKGAPDEVLAHCTHILRDGSIEPLTDAVREQVLRANKDMADRALRVLAAATRAYDVSPETSDPNVLERELVFLGLAGMIDPVRPEVRDAIDECKRAGIRAIMITGDHKDTAVAIARELGILKSAENALTGAELSKLSDAEFEARIEDISVYARVQPEHKVRIVNAWRKRGKVTAMTGDGVNDAPAIKSADIGVGMGITGTDVTKDVADMVLADDNFASIVSAVEEGRRIYENIRKAIQFLLGSNLSEVLAVFVCTLLNTQLLAPIHILWINLVTDSLPAIALGMEEAEPDSMEQPPRRASDGVFANGLGACVVYQGILIAALTLTAFFLGSRASAITGMTMAFVTLSLTELFHSFNMRSRKHSIFSMPKQNKYLIASFALCFVLTMLVVFVPGLNTVFKLTALSASQFAIAFFLAFTIIPVEEIIKCFRRKSHARKA